MSRTAGRFLMDTPIPDGRIFIGAQKNLQATAPTITAAGNYFVPVGAGAATTFDFIVDSLILRYGMSDDALQQFGMGTPSGGFQGAQGQATTSTTPFTTPYGPTGRPPVLAANLLKPVTSRPKGIMPLAVHLVYSVIGVAATSVSVQLTKTSFTPGAAPAISNIIAPDVTSPVGVSALVVSNVLVPVANQAFLADPFDELSLRVIFTTPAGSTANFYGAFIDAAVNLN